MTTDTTIFLTEAVIDTFDVYSKNPTFDNVELRTQLTTSYDALRVASGESPQWLFDSISKAVHDVSAAADHVVLVEGDDTRTLTCVVCGAPLHLHDAGKAITDVASDLEARAALLGYTPSTEG